MYFIEIQIHKTAPYSQSGDKSRFIPSHYQALSLQELSTKRKKDFNNNI